MAHKTDDIQQDIEDTQRDINDTRSAMTEKLELLGERVRETVEDAQASVEGIVEKVKGTVEDTVATVQRIFDLHYQVEQHPWLLVGGATLVGYLLGCRGNGGTSAAVSTNDTRFSLASTPAASSSESSALPSQPPQGIGSGVLEQLKDEIAILKSAAVGAMVSTLWDVVKQALLPPPTPPLTSPRTKQGSQSSDRPAQTQTTSAGAAINGATIF
jgi:ElaB/YqjD/DUF883 family membrane-anchored ribosome-binding protein